MIEIQIFLLVLMIWAVAAVKLLAWTGIKKEDK